MDEDVEVRMEALKLVKDWTIALVVLQSAAIGVAGSLIEKHAPKGWHIALAVAMFVALLAAIYVGAICVAGTIPAIAQKLPLTLGEDIYLMRGGLSGARRWPLGRFCIWQSHLFLISLILFSAFVVLGG